MGGKVDTVSGQVQSLNDSVDELKTRIAKLDKTVQDLQAQLQNMQTAPPRWGDAGQCCQGPCRRAVSRWLGQQAAVGKRRAHRR